MKSMYNDYLATGQEYDELDDRISDFIRSVYEECKHNNISFRDMSHFIDIINRNIESEFVLLRASDMYREAHPSCRKKI